MLNAILTTAALRTFIADEGLSVAEDATDEQVRTTAMKIANAEASQSKFAAFLINVTKGDIDNETLTEALREQFPTAKIGDRHGPHYASLSRSGKLKGCRYAVAKAGRTSSGGLKAKLARAEALIESIRDAKNIKEVRELINGYDNPSAE